MCLCMCYQKSPIAVNEHTIHFVSAQKRRAKIKTAAMSCNNGPRKTGEKNFFKESSLGILFQLYSIPPSPSNFDKRAQSCLLFRTISLPHLFLLLLFLLLWCLFIYFWRAREPGCAGNKRLEKV